jgi:uncharacterized protein YlaI
MPMATSQDKPFQLPLFPLDVTCRVCDATKSVDQFTWRMGKAGRRLHTYICRPCAAAYLRAYRAKNAEVLRQKEATQYRANKEQLKARQRSYYARNRKRIIAYMRSYQRRESRQHWQRDYRAMHREALSARAREWRLAHREERKAYDKEQRKAFPERYRVCEQRRRARERGAEGSYSGADLRRIYDEQQGLCYYCSAALDGRYDVEHKTPLSRGGSNWPDNVCCACRDCNRRKRAKTEGEFKALLAREGPTQARAGNAPGSP